MTRGDRPDRAAAFEAYLQLGANRSLEKLHARLAADYASAPCLRSLKTWSSEGAWPLRVRERADLVRILASTDGVPINRDTAAAMHRVAYELMVKALKMAGKVKDGDANTLAIVADVAIRISKHALDVERGRPPSAERLQELMASIGKANPSDANITPMPGAATPEDQAKPSILRQFDQILGAAKDRVH